MAKKIPFIVQKVVVGPGTARFPRLSKPDTKFKPEGEFSVKLILSGDDAQKFVERAEAFSEEAHRTAEKSVGKALPLSVHKCFRPHEDEDGNAIPGEIVVNFKMKASGEKDGKRWTRKPVVVDAKKNPVTELVGGGSIIKVAGRLRAYYGAAIGFGITADLSAVQVLDLKSAAFGADAFDEEDGFESSDRTSSSADDDDDGDEDF